MIICAYNACACWSDMVEGSNGCMPRIVQLALQDGGTGSVAFKFEKSGGLMIQK
jgi:hypothetical protein